MFLSGKKIFLRAVVPSDAELLYQWENDKANWGFSGTQKPFTKKEIHDFISNQKDIYLDKQLRLMIGLLSTSTSEYPIGCIDLFEFDEPNLKAGIGILIDKEFRKNGYASEALALLIRYSFEILNLKELFCTISAENIPSLKLFKKQKFKVTKENNQERNTGEKSQNVFTLKLMNR